MLTGVLFIVFNSYLAVNTWTDLVMEIEVPTIILFLPSKCTDIHFSYFSVFFSYNCPNFHERTHQGCYFCKYSSIGIGNSQRNGFTYQLWPIHALKQEMSTGNLFIVTSSRFFSHTRKLLEYITVTEWEISIGNIIYAY